jgi:hypothetical protein
VNRTLEATKLRLLNLLGFPVSAVSLQLVEGLANVSEDSINWSFSRDLCTLGSVSIHDRFRMFVEGVKTFLDGLNIVISPTTGLTTFQQTLGHCVIRNWKAQEIEQAKFGGFEGSIHWVSRHNGLG